MMLSSRRPGTWTLSRPLGTVAVLLMMAGVAVAQAPPSISTTRPLAVRPGQAVDLKIQGANLVGVSDVWTSFKSTKALVGDTKNKAQCVYKLTVPADAPVGIHAIRVAGPGGLSPLKLVLVDDIPTTAQAGDNFSREKAQALTLPAAVDGTADALKVRVYKFTAEKGQTVSAEIVAKRIGSALDPLLRLLDANGRELVYSDDAAGLNGDSRLHHTFAAKGEYFIEVRDIQWTGGGGHQYRLRVGDFPDVTAAYPLGVKRGSSATVSFAGAHITGVEPVKLQLPANSPLEWLTIGAKRSGGKSSGLVTLAVSNSDEVVESEPNDSRDKATRVPLGANLNGRFDKAGDVDHYVVTAKKGQKFTFTGITRRVGSPAAVVIRLLDAKGGKVAEVVDLGINDSVINYTFPADGNFYVAVQDRDRRGGGGFAYRVSVDPVATGFKLTASAAHLNIAVGGTAAITVNAARSGYNGPISVAAVGLPAGITSTPTVIGTGRTNAVLTLTADDKAPKGKIVPIRVAGTAKIGETDTRADANVETPLKGIFGGLAWPPSTLSQEVAVAVAPPAVFSLRTSPQTVVFGRDLTAKVKVTVVRHKDYKEAINLVLQPAKNGLPGGISAGLKAIPAGKNEIEITFTANNKAPLGEFTANLNAQLKKGKNTTTQPVPSIGLSLKTPLSLKAAAAGPKLARGKQLKLKVTVERNPSLAGPVVLTVANLPKGVTAAAATIAADKTEVEIVLSAAQDAQQGGVKNLVVKGTTTVGKVKHAADSAAVAVTVE